MVHQTFEWSRLMNYFLIHGIHWMLLSILWIWWWIRRWWFLKNTKYNPFINSWIHCLIIINSPFQVPSDLVEILFVELGYWLLAFVHHWMNSPELPDKFRFSMDHKQLFSCSYVCVCVFGWLCNWIMDLDFVFVWFTKLIGKWNRNKILYS